MKHYDINSALSHQKKAEVLNEQAESCSIDN